MFEDLDIPSNFRAELLPLVESLMQLQDEVVQIASKFNRNSFYFIPTMLPLPSYHYTGMALHDFATSRVNAFINLIMEAGRGGHHSNDTHKTVIDQLRFVIDFDYDTLRENLEEIKGAIEVGSENELKERQDRFRAETRERMEKEFPGLAQARRQLMH